MNRIPHGLFPMGSDSLVPYATDGLVAWYDAIWNAGVGVRVDSATVWKDLAGTRDATLRRGANGWGADALRTRSLTGGTAATLPAATMDGFAFASVGAFEIVFRIDAAQNSNGETLAFVGGQSRTAFSFVSGGTAGEILIFSTPSTRIAAVPGNGNPADICTLGVRHALSVNLGEEENVAGWSFRHNGTELGLYNRGGTLTVQTNGVGSVFGRTTSASSPDNAVGEICCLRLYSRVLTDDERKRNYASDKQRYDLP